MLSIFEIVALLLGLSAMFGWLNVRFVKMPHMIGLLVMAFGSSIGLIALEKLVPGLGVTEELKRALEQIDLYTAIVNGMLAFLLFAGALHVDIHLLKGQKWAIGLMATFGVVISTAIVGLGVFGVCRLVGFEMPLIWALVFGALISPTDPVAVLGLLKVIKVPEAIKAQIAGESLFNDGAAVVIFIALLTIALGVPAGEPIESHWQPGSIAALFLFEAVGAIVFGLFTGWIAYRAMDSIDDPTVEILISLGICAMTYALALRLHISGPIAVVMTGLLIGNHRAERATSDGAGDHLFPFWAVVDEVLNSILFLLIGLEVFVFGVHPRNSWMILVAIPIVLFARWVSVSVPILVLSLKQSISPGAIPILTWGGLRGGVSVALALSLPATDYKSIILTATFAVVIFSIVVQGLTVERVIKRTAV
ncbi:sodium:proton antiporter [Mesorhizobium sp. BAC0120]|uniref:cation:proton antiporter n=1 Tax=Mesorhizobium sp. BAC0120 TaxID=3090670 RepID=UPI00298CC9A8|nr:sodium:proton antiporter [Mesorhizobium sp. BAC0120]MDW6020661.1 sodium:proton antiporter [Mesorhizobium sp. BAC0120]